MEQVELTKTDVEKKVERILKLVKRRSKKKEAEIIALVEDFHRQYQSLFAQYEHFKRKSGEKTPKEEGNESYPCYESGQESEYYSPTDVETETDTPFDNNRGSHRWMADNIKEELKRAYGEDADMKHHLASKTEEREALVSDNLPTSSKTQEIENIGKDEVTSLKTEMESMHHEISKLREENSHLNSRIVELEALFRERGLELSAHDKKSAQISAEVKHLQMEKTKVELQTADQQITMKEIEENTYKSIESDSKLVKQLCIGNNLETKLSEEDEQKLKMSKDVSVLENKVRELVKINKEKDEALLSRNEEKREAIKQLCVFIEYHRNRCDHLKESISNLTVRVKKKTNFYS